MVNHLTFFIGIVILLILSASFSGSETALMSLTRAQLQRMKNGTAGERAAWKLMRQPQRVMAALLLGNLFVNTLLTTLTAALLSHLLPPNSWLSVVVNILVVTPLLIICGELSPKVNAYRFNLTVARFCAKPILLFSHLVSPALRILQGCSEFLQKLFHINLAARGWDMLTVDEVAADLDASAQTGAATTAEHDLLGRILQFGRIEVKEVMIPRTQIIGLPDHLTLAEAALLAHKTIYNFLPVYHETLDEIWGIAAFSDTLEWDKIPQKDCKLSEFREALENGSTDVDLPLSPIAFVPATAKIDRVLSAMKAQASRMNVVVSEYGGTLGIITRSTILEEIVGKYACSGRDPDVLRPMKSSDGFLADGRARLRAIEDALEIELESENETLGGFIMEKLGKIPEVHDEFAAAGYRFRVLRTAGHIASAVSLEKIPAAPKGLAAM